MAASKILLTNIMDGFSVTPGTLGDIAVMFPLGNIYPLSGKIEDSDGNGLVRWIGIYDSDIKRGLITVAYGTAFTRTTLFQSESH